MAVVPRKNGLASTPTLPNVSLEIQKKKVPAHRMREQWRHSKVNTDCSMGIYHGEVEGIRQSISLPLKGGCYVIPEGMEEAEADALKKSLREAGFIRETVAIATRTRKVIPDEELEPGEKVIEQHQAPEPLAKPKDRPLVSVDDMPNAGRWILEHPDHVGADPNANGVILTLKGVQKPPIDLVNGFITTEDPEIRDDLISCGYRLFKTGPK